MTGRDGLRIRDWLVGQEALLARFDRIGRDDRLAHAHLLLGAPGSGRTRLALALAQQILCTTPEAPCGECGSCRRAARLLHADLHFIIPLVREEAEDPAAVARLLEEYASNRYDLLGRSGSASIGIDRVRDLKEAVAKAPVEGDRRVVVISGAGQMTEQAAQAALKLVEEPPPRTTLLLTAEDPSRLLPTLVSRCQKTWMRPVAREQLQEILERDLGSCPPESGLLAALAGGCLGRALEMREIGILELRDNVLEIFALPSIPAARSLRPRDIERRVQAVERIWTADLARRAAEILLIWHHDLLLARSGLLDLLVNQDRTEDIRRQAEGISGEEIGRRNRLIEEMAAAIDQNVNPALALSSTLARLGSAAIEEDRLLSP